MITKFVVNRGVVEILGLNKELKHEIVVGKVLFKDIHTF